MDDRQWARTAFRPVELRGDPEALRERALGRSSGTAEVLGQVLFFGLVFAGSVALGAWWRRRQLQSAPPPPLPPAVPRELPAWAMS